jgi:asparagine synthase (glutamine-hydrolysing)
MCGIYGQYNFRSRRPIVESELHEATRTIAHRGPDDEGFYVRGPLGLGFRRLSIIDLSGGHQPMSDPEESVWIIFNGEIYNFQELRAELEDKGHVFRTRSDTEVIIHGYKEWGDDVLNRLNGMFGLALWDERNRRLIVARDAMGIKPVYYRIEDGELFFASEIRALVESAHRPIDIDPVSLNLFLRYRYTPSPLTLFEGIRKLAAGTMLVVENGEAKEERWYRFRPTPFESDKTLPDAKIELLELYRAALKRHLISDVPVGLLLSGGVDSSLLLALMSELGTSWHTYSVGYGSTFKDDELEDASRTAAHFFSRHVSVELTREGFERSLSRVVTSLEEPVAASSIIPMFAVCERARQDVKVALIGQGPDELFGGYSRHLGVHYGGLWRSTPAGLRTAVAAVAARLPRNELLKRGLYALDVPDRLRRHQNTFSILPGDVIDGLFKDGLLDAAPGDTILDCWAELQSLASDADELTAFQWLEIQSSLPDELLMYGDKMSMAHSLEVRVPYLDRTVVEYALRLDASLKIHRGSRKYVHRAVAQDFLPPDVIRRKKRGFAANVVDDWFQHALSARMDAMFLDSQSHMYQFLDPASVQRLHSEHRTGASDNHKVLFSLVVLEQWLRSTRATMGGRPAASDSGRIHHRVMPPACHHFSH